MGFKPVVVAEQGVQKLRHRSILAAHKPCLFRQHHREGGPHGYRGRCDSASRRPAMGTETGTDWDAYNQRWHEIWGNKLPPGERFDLGGPTPALVSALEKGDLHVKGKSVFIPGCGRGYDVVEFAKFGAAPALGIDLSEAGVEAAQVFVESCSLAPDVRENTLIRTGDFFKDTFEAADVGFDYTFLCALHPDMRRDWAKVWGSLIKPSGQLIAQLFPLEAPGREGPPWPLQPELYDDLLIPEGFEKVESTPVPEHLSCDSRKGKEVWLRWRKI
eukprot:jgi/Botrbrau1/5603/Bobra.97_2s0026.2